MNVVLYFRVLEFATHSDARNVIRKLDGTTLNGKKIRLIDVRDLYCHMLNDVPLYHHQIKQFNPLCTWFSPDKRDCLL